MGILASRPLGLMSNCLVNGVPSLGTPAFTSSRPTVFKETGVGDRGGDLTDDPEGLGRVFVGGWVGVVCVCV